MRYGNYEMEYADDLSSFVTETNEVNQISISDNGDRNKILGTIVEAIDRYTERFPERTIYFVASTDARTRLYRMAIGQHLDDLSTQYYIYADTDSQDEWVPFKKNLETRAFLIKRKTL